jgi:hypothetical protein
MNFILPTLISSILIITGWIVLFSNAKKIASRAETKSIIDLIVNKTDTLSVYATKYWLSNDASRETPVTYELQFMNQISQICGLMNILPSRGISVSFEEIQELILKGTLNCESIKKNSPEQRQITAHEINSASILCIENLYKTFQEIHKPQK